MFFFSTSPELYAHTDSTSQSAIHTPILPDPRCERRVCRTAGLQCWFPNHFRSRSYRRCACAAPQQEPVVSKRTQFVQQWCSPRIRLRLQSISSFCFSWLLSNYDRAERVMFSLLYCFSIIISSHFHRSRLVFFRNHAILGNGQQRK